MYVLFDDNGYVSSYVLVGKVANAEEFADPEDKQLFIQHSKAYRKDGDALVFDAAKYAELQQEELKIGLRHRRTCECFPIVNRGSLWHETLSTEQTAELRQWYHSWLDVTDTLVAPEMPAWLK